MYNRCGFHLPSPSSPVGQQFNYNHYFFTPATCLLFSFNIYFYFCRHNLSTSCHFYLAVPVIQDTIPSWYLSQHKFISTQFGTSVSWCRSCLYLSSIPLPTPSLLFLSLPRNFQTQSIGFLLSSIHFPPVYL